MNELPMPSDLRASAQPESSNQVTVEPPSVKLIVRLFLIPFLIVATAVGVIYLISLMAGRDPTIDEAITGLKSAGGERTGELLVGPGSKQRYLYAKTLTDKMKLGMTPEQREKLSNQIIDVLDHYTRPEEGEVEHFLLLALGRAWQTDPQHPQADSAAAAAARHQAAQTLLRYAASKDIPTRKAALLAMVYFRGHDEEVKQFVPILSATVSNESEDLDVRLAAATALGPLASRDDRTAVDSLRSAMRDSDPRDVELVWQSALSLAQLGQSDVADTILKLLDRNELASVQVYDRETDPKNPIFRKLSEAEQERILINTMIGVEKYNVPAVQERLKKIAENDPSQRVRAALRSKAPRDAAQ